MTSRAAADPASTGRTGRSRAARPLHPGAWWAWSLGLAVVASTTRSAAVLLLLTAVLGLVVTARRPDAPWSRSFSALVPLALALVALRVVVATLFGARTGEGQVLLRVPEIPLPDWAAGVQIGGPVTDVLLGRALLSGGQLAVLVLCIAAASSLASPYRTVRCLPAALHEVGVAITVAVTFVPEAVRTASAVREARALRGRPSSGVAGLRGMATPVLEGALERSLRLAESLDSRGYGRRGDLPARVHALGAGALLVALVASGAAAYGLLGGASYGTVAALVAGLAAVVSLRISGRSVVRTRHRPDPWRTPETVTAVTSVVAALLSVQTGPDGLVLGPWRTLGLEVGPWTLLGPTAAAAVLLLAVLAAALPAVLAPPPSLATPMPPLASARSRLERVA